MTTSNVSAQIKKEIDEEFQLEVPAKRLKVEDSTTEQNETVETPTQSTQSNIIETPSQSTQFQFDAEPKPKTVKKNKHSAEHKLSGYNKKEILKFLKEHGCSSRSFEKALRSFKVRRDCALTFLNKHLEDAQEYVYQECDSLSFENIAEWLKLFKTWQLPEHSLFEHAMITNAIANNEKHPAPEDLGGVDLKLIYKFLGSAMLGLPPPELSGETAAFLNEEFEMLINEANTDEADAETRQLKSQLHNQTVLRNTKGQQKLSLDPLLLDENMLFDVPH